MFKKYDATQMGFLEDPLLFVVKGSYLWILLNPLGSKG
jgi:hypothetical protein